MLFGRNRRAKCGALMRRRKFVALIQSSLKSKWEGADIPHHFWQGDRFALTP